jgi:hypothetical protein
MEPEPQLDEIRRTELDRDERWLASIMTPTTPGPSDETLDRVRGAVRVAIDERWLEKYEAPAPAPEAIHRIKAAVHETLRAGDRRGVRYRVFGAMSAAAAILLAVGVVRFAAPRATGALDMAGPGDSFTAAWDAIENDTGMKSLTTDMAWLDEEMNAWANRPARPTDDLEMESLQDQVDQLFATPDYFAGTS